MEQININFKVFLVPTDYTNLIASATLGYSSELNFSNQQGALNSAILGLDNEIDYYLNCDKNRIIIAIKILKENDPFIKESVYQIGYFGKLRIYGGEWSFSSNFASIGSSYDLNTRFSNVNKGNLENPKLIINGNIVNPSTNISGWSLDTLDISPYPNGELYCTPVFYFKNNSKNINTFNSEKTFDGEIYGELDGVVKIVATGEIKSEDTINIKDHEYIVIQDGINKDAYNLFAIRKD